MKTEIPTNEPVAQLMTLVDKYKDAQAQNKYGNLPKIRAAIEEAALGLQSAQAAPQASEPYAVLVFERGEEGPFDRKPVKPNSMPHLHAKRDPHYDYIELYTHPTQQGLDARQYQRGYQDGYNRRDAEVKGALV